MRGIWLLPASLGGFVLGKVWQQTRRPSSRPDGVVLVAWERFVALMCQAPKGEVSPRGHMGTFQMDARRLGDVGLMHGARKDVTGSWTGEWRSPLTREKFLGSMPLQYVAFSRSMRAMAPKVSRLVGSVVDGKQCTLSGLLGVGHVAGEGAVEGWARDAAVRRRFARTTEMFDKTNGVF